MVRYGSSFLILKQRYVENPNEKSGYRLQYAPVIMRTGYSDRCNENHKFLDGR